MSHQTVRVEQVFQRIHCYNLCIVSFRHLQLLAKTSPEKEKEFEWKRDLLLKRHKARLEHEKLIKKLNSKQELDEDEKRELEKRRAAFVQEPPTMEQLIEDLKLVS